MNEDDVRRQVLAALVAVAPEIDPTHIDVHEPIREQFDIDSVDLLNFIMTLESMFSVQIPETDYERIGSVAELVAYLLQRMNGRG